VRSTSYSELTTFQRCPWRWGCRYLRHLEEAEPSAGLRIGRALHEGLASYYTGKYPDFKSVDSEEDRNLCRGVMRSYVEKWADSDSHMYEVLAAEWPFVVSVPTPQGVRSNFRMLGWIDLVVRNHRGEIEVMDHKSGKSFPRSGTELSMDAQLLTYLWALRVLGVKADTGHINLLRLTKQPKFDRLDMLYTADRLGRWGENLYKVCRSLPAPSTTMDDLPRSVTRSCYWDCPYYDICLLDLSGDDIAPLLSSGFQMSESRRTLSAYNRSVPDGWLR